MLAASPVEGLPVEFEPQSHHICRDKLDAKGREVVERDAQVREILRFRLPPGIVCLPDCDLGFFHLGMPGQRRGLGCRQVLFEWRQCGHVLRAKLGVYIAAQQIVQIFFCRGKLVLILKELVPSSASLAFTSRFSDFSATCSATYWVVMRSSS